MNTQKFFAIYHESNLTGQPLNYNKMAKEGIKLIDQFFDSFLVSLLKITILFLIFK